MPEAVAEVALVITLHMTTKTFSMNLKKETSISDATDQSAASKADFAILLKYAAMSTKQMS